MNTYHNAALVLSNAQVKEGKTQWSSPSNLAIIKYWGKYGVQFPRNPSISLTLNTSKSITEVEWKERDNSSKGIQLNFFFDKKENIPFSKRLHKFLTSIVPIFPFLEEIDLTISSENTFPHSSGIASSASAMSALAVCLCDIERTAFNTLQADEEFFKKASFIARLGSGSACRSLYPSWAQWGDWSGNETFSNLWATPVDGLHDSFMDMHDTILIANKGEKSISSSAGHQLMEDNVYAAARYQQANDRLGILLGALKNGDWDTFGKITENEALTLHALMMSSESSYILLKPSTLLMIDRIRAYRQKTGLPVYFSLDAGPNIHMLYPHTIAKEIESFIQEELIELCQDKMILYDGIGKGAKKLS